MPHEGNLFGLAVHATAIAHGRRALLITGRSGSGKSRLAAALIAMPGNCRFTLLGDDRVLLSHRGEGIEARPHPRIAGFIERRGIGIMAMPWLDRAVVAAVASLEGSVPLPPCLSALPVLPLQAATLSLQVSLVRAWWQRLGTIRDTEATRRL